MSTTDLLVLKGGTNKAGKDYLVLKVTCFVFTHNKNCRAVQLYLSKTSILIFKKMYKWKGRRK